MPCTNHPEREGAGVCSICNREYCAECLIQLPDRKICVNCKPAYLAGLGMSQGLTTEGKKGNKGACLIFGLVLAFFFIVVIGILAAIAIPNFLKFQSKAKQSEAKSNLGAIFTTQMAYFAENNTYAGTAIIDGKPMNAFQLTNWEPSGQNRYNYYMDDAAIPAKMDTARSKCKFHPRIKVTKTGFTACAVGNIDSDDFCDVWCINNDKVLKNQECTAEEWGADGNDDKN